MTLHGFELVVFDCDGVLVDSEVIAVRVDQLVLADLGWELELEEIVECFVGRTEAHFIASIEDQLGIALGEGWDRKYDPWYRSAFERGMVAVGGVVEALDGIRLPHCVASSGTHATEAAARPRRSRPALTPEFPHLRRRRPVCRADEPVSRGNAVTKVGRIGAGRQGDGLVRAGGVGISSGRRSQSRCSARRRQRP
ncbi:MAG: hypothetical protein U1D68_09585 [Arthrobacter sp.]|nr:hypothetical protein [Arthrobacter sp.]MDZ4351035.1 hypothetical protein [Arthrobacter sp.]